MKKIFAILLTSAMLFSAALPVFASVGTETLATDTITAPEEDYPINVDGIHQSGTPAVDTVCVDVVWEEMKFTYTASDATYDPTDHKTDYGKGSWSDNKPAITVTNHSNIGIDASFEFTKNQDHVYATVVGKFYDKNTDESSSVTYTENTSKKLSLASGEKTSANEANYTPPTGSICFGIDNSASSSMAEGNSELGTITVTISKALRVSSGAMLSSILNDIKLTGGTVTLDQDVELPTIGDISVLQLIFYSDESAAAPIILDLNGHKITGVIGVMNQNGDSAPEIVIKNGTVEYDYAADTVTALNSGVITNWGVALELNKVTVNVISPGNMVALANAESATTTAIDCTFNSSVTYNGTQYTISNSADLILAGNITISNCVYGRVYGNTVTLKKNCKYTINGGTETTVTEDTTYTRDTTVIPTWLKQ